MTEFVQFIRDFAAAMMRVDARRPRWRKYQPGIGPHTEKEIVRLVTEEILSSDSDAYNGIELEVDYPESGKCDVCLGSAPQWDWAIEIKALRFMGDNGKPNDMILQHILSPYSMHRSALSDTEKLINSGFPGRKAILIYGYDYPSKDPKTHLPMDPAIAAFELLAEQRVQLSKRVTAPLDNLVHPVHRQGRVFGWEITPNER